MAVALKASVEGRQDEERDEEEEDRDKHGGIEIDDRAQFRKFVQRVWVYERFN